MIEMNTALPRIFYTQEDMIKDLRKIVRSMGQKGFKPDFIFGIARGGLVPATYLSHYFNVPMFTANFERDRVADDEFDIIANALRMQKKVLMVDEICDEGKTLDVIWDIFYKKCPDLDKDEPMATVVERNLHTAVLVNNIASEKFLPDYVGTEINKDENPAWVIFDWENWA